MSLKIGSVLVRRSPREEPYLNGLDGAPPDDDPNAAVCVRPSTGVVASDTELDECPMPALRVNLCDWTRRAWTLPGRSRSLAVRARCLLRRMKSLPVVRICWRRHWAAATRSRSLDLPSSLC